MIIKTIDVNAKEWFDKINGNSYFSGVVILNYGLEDEQVLNLPFQYGYGDHYQDMGFKVIQDTLKIKTDKRLCQYCKDNKIILRTHKQENCLKRDLK